MVGGTDAGSRWTQGWHAEPISESQAETSGAAFSPDGRWIAYQSIESGSSKSTCGLFRRHHPGTMASCRSQTAGDPTGDGCRTDASYSICRGPDHGGRTSPCATVRWLRASRACGPRTWNGASGFDVSPTASGCVLLPASTSEPRQDHTVVLLQNFFDELRRRAPASR